MNENIVRLARSAWTINTILNECKALYIISAIVTFDCKSLVLSEQVSDRVCLCRVFTVLYSQPMVKARWTCHSFVNHLYLKTASKIKTTKQTSKAGRTRCKAQTLWYRICRTTSVGLHSPVSHSCRTGIKRQKVIKHGVLSVESLIAIVQPFHG